MSEDTLQEYVLRIRKKNWVGVSHRDLMEYAARVLISIPCDGLNPYKMVEMWKNYQPNVPPEYHSDEMYAEPSPDILSKVKMEKVDRSEFRATLKAKNMRRRRSELKARRSTAKRARLERVGFFSRRGFFPHSFLISTSERYLPHFSFKCITDKSTRKVEGSRHAHPLFWPILCLSARFMLITPKYKNRAFNAYQQANAVLCLSASEYCFMLISAFHAYQLEDMVFNAYRGVENN